MSHTPIEPDISSSYGTPRWVKVVGVVVIVLILALGIMLVVGGEHGPGRHSQPDHVTEPDNGGGHTSPINHGGQ